jgi:hypothetical protein
MQFDFDKLLLNEIADAIIVKTRLNRVPYLKPDPKRLGPRLGHRLKKHGSRQNSPGHFYPQLQGGFKAPQMLALPAYFHPEFMGPSFVQFYKSRA